MVVVGPVSCLPITGGMEVSLLHWKGRYLLWAGWTMSILPRLSHVSHVFGLQICNWCGVESEHELYAGMICGSLSRRKRVVRAFENSFDILDEARFLLHCRTLPGTVPLEGVCIVKDPCRRVTGLLLEYFPKGDLESLLEYGPAPPVQLICTRSTLTILAALYLAPGDTFSNNAFFCLSGSLLLSLFLLPFFLRSFLCILYVWRFFFILFCFSVHPATHVTTWSC